MRECGAIRDMRTIWLTPLNVRNLPKSQTLNYLCLAYAYMQFEIRYLMSPRHYFWGGWKYPLYISTKTWKDGYASNHIENAGGEDGWLVYISEPGLAEKNYQQIINWGQVQYQLRIAGETVSVISSGMATHPVVLSRFLKQRLCRFTCVVYQRTRRQQINN